MLGLLKGGQVGVGLAEAEAKADTFPQGGRVGVGLAEADTCPQGGQLGVGLAEAEAKADTCPHGWDMVDGVPVEGPG